MVTEVEMTVWIQSVWSCETLKDQIVQPGHYLWVLVANCFFIIPSILIALPQACIH